MAGYKQWRYRIALAGAASHDVGSAAQNELASIPRSVQVSSKLAVSKTFLGPSLVSDNHSFLLLLNDSKKKLAECQKELKGDKNEKKVS